MLENVMQAKEIFKGMYPDEDFLPRAPDPEEIVLEGDETPGPRFEGDSECTEKQDVEKAEKDEWNEKHVNVWKKVW